jgi:hypothetical protein
MIDEPSWVPEGEPPRCPTCLKPVELGMEITCVCHHDGIAGHEDKAWCSVKCMADDHLD